MKRKSRERGKEDGRGREREQASKREGECFYLLDHSPNDRNGQGCAKPKPGATRNTIWTSHMGTITWVSSSVFSGSISRELEVEQIRLTPVPILDAAVQHVTCFIKTLIPIPVFYQSSCFQMMAYVVGIIICMICTP